MFVPVEQNSATRQQGLWLRGFEPFERVMMIQPLGEDEYWDFQIQVDSEDILVG